MRWLLSVVGLVAITMTVDAQPAPKPVRLIAEAEDFTPKGPGWKVVPFRENYYASTFAISFLSRMGCLGAPEQLPPGKPAIAEQIVEIPHADEYQILARYEQPYNFACEFSVEIEQGGKVVDRVAFGRLTDPRIWALNQHARIPMERYWWGGTDNIVWQQPKAVRLQAGPATLRLIAAEQLDGTKPRINSARRHVDVICLTNDKAGIEAQRKTNYLEFDGWLVQDGDLFVRITNPKDGYGPCVPVLAPFPSGQHSPYYVHVRDWPTTRVLKSGRMTDATAYLLTGPRSLAVKPQALAPVVDPSLFTKAPPNNPKAPPVLTIPDAEYLQPGDTSGWVPLGNVVDALYHSQWHPSALYKGKAEGLYLRLEFAIPDGKGGLKPIKDITVKGTPAYLSPVTFEVPGNIAPNPAMLQALQERHWVSILQTQKESLDRLNAEVAKFPKKGQTPKRFLVYNLLGFGTALLSFPEAQQLAVALGDNTAVNQQGKKRDLVAHWWDPKIETIQKQEKALKNGGADLRVVSYGDEIHLPAAPVTDEEFATWLKQRGITPPGPVKFVSIKPKDTPAAIAAAQADPLYYYSQICSKEKGGKLYADATAYLGSKGVLTGANYSPHANYLVTELDYIRTFKLKAMSMPWSEDYVWQIPEFSVQVTGYLTSGLRAGAKYNDLPIHMYVMPHSPGNTPRDFRLSFYTAVAHGTKIVNYFCATPSSVGTTENYVDTGDLGMWRAIHACTHEAGIFEDYVMDGKVRPAKVGLLLSSVDDVVTGVSNSTFAMHNNERKALYYALRHSQVPVDFLSEDDVIEGRAKDYHVIYVTQQYLHSKAILGLTEWAKNGGTVVALVGGGFRNEFQKENPDANTLFGVKRQQLTTDPQLVSKYLLKENTPFLTKQDLPLYQPIDEVTWRDRDHEMKGLPVVVWKQTLEASDGTVVGTFKDGKPAMIRKTHGKGQAYLFGFLPGQAYLKSGLPILPPDRGSTDAGFSHFLPTTMDPTLRKALVDGFLPKDYSRPVECSETLVESTCIDDQKGHTAVPLMNFTGKPIGKLTVRVRGIPPTAKVRSVERGPLTPRFANGEMTVEIPLDVADMLLIDR